MCCSWSRKKLCIGGFIATLIFIAVGIVVLIMSGVNMGSLSQSFSSGSFAQLGTIQMVAMCYVLGIAGIGIIAFCCKDKCGALMFVIFLFVSFIFTLAVAVLGFFTGAVSSASEYVSCKSNYTALLSIWNGIDTYLIEADKSLCSSNCPCGLTNTTAYATYAAYTSTYSVQTGQTVNFTNCPAAAVTAAYDNAVKNNKEFDTTQTFSASGFAKAYAYVESFWSCTGFCVKEYEKVSGSGVKTPIFRYLFNDINLGPAKNVGCMNQILLTLPQFLTAYGVMAAILASGQFVALLFGCSLCLSDDNHPDDMEPVEEPPKEGGVEVQAQVAA